MVAATPRPASTVALLRDGAEGAHGADGIEVWLMRRSVSMAFAGGMHAFPGGAVEDDDHDPALPWTEPVAGAGAAAVLGVEPAEAAVLLSAAVRETFEECGVLVASRTGAPGGCPDDRRDALLAHDVRWAALLDEAGARLDASALVPWARWVTPEWSPRRFDAWFFLARVPERQQPRWIDGEADRAGWHGVRAAVAAHERGELPMLPPTITTLRELAPHASVADAFAAAPPRIVTASG